MQAIFAVLFSAHHSNNSSRFTCPDCTPLLWHVGMSFGALLNPVHQSTQARTCRIPRELHSPRRQLGRSDLHYVHRVPVTKNAELKRATQQTRESSKTRASRAGGRSGCDLPKENWAKQAEYKGYTVNLLTKTSPDSQTALYHGSCVLRPTS